MTEPQPRRDASGRGNADLVGDRRADVPGAGSSSARTEVAVVGAGPAGMAAAAAAAHAGARVTVLDTYAAAGGQYHRRQDATATGPADTPANRRFAALVAAGRIAVWSGVTVWTAARDAGFRLELTAAETTRDAAPPAPRLRAEVVIIATGAVDRALPFPGWDLPGVFTAGGAQALLKGHGVVAGHRVVVGGSGPFLLPVAAGLADAGSDVVAVVEASRLPGLVRQAHHAFATRAKLAEAAGYLGVLARHRVTLRHGHAVVRADGDSRVEQVTIAAVDAAWAPRPGTERTVAVDAACVSFGFVPQVGLAALLGADIAPDPWWGDPAVVVDDAQATRVPGLLAAGESTGVTGATGSAAAGVVAGLTAARLLGRAGHARLDASARRTRTRERRLAGVLAALYPTGARWIDWLTDATLVCRCEEVDVAAVRAAVNDLGASDLRSVKLTTRCGMGVCQARMCGSAVDGLVRDLTGAAPPDAGALAGSPVLTPVPLGELAALADVPRAGQGT